MTPMNEAAGVRPTPAAAHETQRTCSLVLKHDPGKFARLQERAARASQVLLQVASGYMLLRGGSSHHSDDLDALAAVLARGGAE